ncbi:MAG: Fic family protein [Bacteroidia bacterium]
MANPAEKLAASLEKLKRLQDKEVVGIKSSDLSRVDRERLMASGFIREVLKGWYIASPHDEQQGNSTSWYNSFWGFCSRYLEDRHGDNYCLSPEQSLNLHAGNISVPKQLVIKATKGNNLPTNLLFDTSIFAMRGPIPDNAEMAMWNELRITSLPSSIIHCTSSCFESHATEVRTALLMIQDASELLTLLLNGGHSTIAGRIVGAFRNIKKYKIADDILKTMKSAGYDVRETDPFEEPTPITFESYERSPYANRIKLIWQKMRETVVEVFPEAPGMPDDKEILLQQIDDLYTTDAYHSLSIEQYIVSPVLIERVRSGEWNTAANEADKNQKHAMAARGYWKAFEAVKNSIQKVFNGENAGYVADADHGDWYRALFGPSVNVGILTPSDLAGYRTNQVYIGQSKHIPLTKDGIRDAMPVLFELLKQERHPGVRAVLGHFIFVYIHPYMDGNGRMGRFLMNVMLISGGYPWTVIPVEERVRYMNTLENASVDMDIKPFAEFIAWLVESGLHGAPVANLDKR